MSTHMSIHMHIDLSKNHVTKCLCSTASSFLMLGIKLAKLPLLKAYWCANIHDQ